MALDCLFSIAGKIAEYAIEPVGRQFGYLIFYSSNIDALRSQLHKLDMEKFKVSQLVDAATRNNELVLPNVQEWLTQSDLINEESIKFLKDQVNDNQKCFRRGLLCPNLVSRYRVSRKCSKKKLEIEMLFAEGRFGIVSIPAPPPQASSAFIGNAGVFKSRESTFKAIMDALQDDEVNMIGVYGMGGIGKTTMVKQVAKEAEQRKFIDEFAMSVISQKPNVPNIQSNIAEWLGLKLDVEGKEVRASRLLKRMSQGKKILLILDDLWTPINLTEIGIPHGCKYCKIILTSRDLDVCKGMNCDRLFLINLLSDADAWSFFRSIAGAAVDSEDLHSIATEIVVKCAGLPIAIITVAQALIGKEKYFWTDALQQLRNSTPKNIKGMHANVFSLLEVSYRFLESDELRYCFLVCCLFKEDSDISIECLVRYGLGLNLFEGVHSVEAARDRAHVLVDNLKDSGLLMDGKERHSAVMHDVLRDFAHYLTSIGGEQVFLVRDGAEIIEWPNSSIYNQCTAISMLSNTISEIPEGLDCPKLQIFIFEHQFGQSRGLKIPSNCFQGMKGLRVLMMSYYSIPSIPPSIAFLANLETLCLEHCILSDICQIGWLKKLKVLSLAGSMFRELPSEIGLLRHLMILDLTDCNELIVIPPNIISSLAKLECLYLLNYYNNQWSWGGGNADVSELNHLQQLNTLEMHVSDISLLPGDFLAKQKLIRYQVCLDGSERLGPGMRRDFDKMLVVPIESDYNYTIPDGVRTLMERSEGLVVNFKGYSPHSSTLTLSDLTKGGFPTLKYLEVKYDYSLKFLVDSSSSLGVTSSLFPLLEELQLQMLGLHNICNGDLPNGSFRELRELRICDLPNLINLWYTNESASCPRLVNLQHVNISQCNKLKHAFPQSASKDLGKLKTLIFRDCDSLEGIFLEDKQHKTSDIIRLPDLKMLSISNVPSLRSFCFHDDEASTAGQQSRTKVLLPSLETLYFISVDQNIYVWLQQLLPKSFLSLTSLHLLQCKRTVTIFPANASHCLQNFVSLNIEDCESLERIVDVEAIPQMQNSQLELPREFPSLMSINISNCPKLKTFAAAAASSSSSPMMEDSKASSNIATDVSSNIATNISAANLTLPFFDEKIMFKTLEHLELAGVDGLNVIWCPRSLSSENFQNLRSVTIKFCNNLGTIFTSSLLRSLKNLHSIEIMECQLVQVVFDLDDEDIASVGALVIPRLQVVKLQHLPNLVCFGQGAAKFPSLRELSIWSCPKMKTFMGIQEHDCNGKFSCPFFDEKVYMPVLEELEIYSQQNLEELWHDQLQAESFNQLKFLIVAMCSNLSKVIHLRLLQGMKNLDTISVNGCKSMKEIVVIDNLVDQSHFNNAQLTRCNLRELKLENIPELVELWWNKDCSGVFSCPNLYSLEVTGCHGLRNIFVASAIKHGMNIKTLKIENCLNMEEVVREEKEGYSRDKLVFRLVQDLSLWNLPNLRRFSGSDCILEWPSLSKMVMNNCPNMQTFCLGTVITPQLKGLSHYNEDGEEALREGGDLNTIIQHLFYIQRESGAVKTEEEMTSIHISCSEDEETASTQKTALEKKEE